jgi:hypothetical protein
MLRTLSENEMSVPARSPSVEKSDIDDPTPHTPGRNGAGTPSDKSDLMSPFWSIIDIPKNRMHVLSSRGPEPPVHGA